MSSRFSQRSPIVLTCIGVAVAVVGNALADVAAFIALRHAGGPVGCGTHLDAGERFGVLVALVVTYLAAQVVLGGAAAGLSALAKPAGAYWTGLGGGWAVLALLSILSVCYPGC